MARARVHRVSLAGTTATTKARVHRVALDGAPIVGPRARVHRVALDGPSAMVLQPLANRTGVEPLSEMVLTAAPAAGSATPSSYVWRRVSGAQVVVPASVGASVRVQAPAGMDGASVVLGVRGVIGSALSPEQTVTVTTLPNIHWLATDTGWVPVKGVAPLTAAPPTPTDLEADTESDTE